ncbi:hypothetical protein BDQ17DRAFT_1429799 [Cyathus striatus]|nr:hypothetical protein BDQ17DRAFT_1429799 [Cyathus striatus]
MQFNLAFFILAAVSTALAAPAELNAKREALVDGHLFVCTDNDFAGDCSNIGFFNNQCSNFSPEFQDDISSWGPDEGWVCTTYTDINCSGLTYTAGNPGFSSLPPGINDAISSFRCNQA